MQCVKPDEVNGKVEYQSANVLEGWDEQSTDVVQARAPRGSQSSFLDRLASEESHTGASFQFKLGRSGQVSWC